MAIMPHFQNPLNALMQNGVCSRDQHEDGGVVDLSETLQCLFLYLHHVIRGAG
jgi:hypothetical protein